MGLSTVAGGVGVRDQESGIRGQKRPALTTAPIVRRGNGIICMEAREEIVKSLLVYAAMLNGTIFGIFFRLACANSYDDCISNQKLGCVPSAADRRNDISAEMPARQLRILDSVTRET